MEYFYLRAKFLAAQSGRFLFQTKMLQEYRKSISLTSTLLLPLPHLHSFLRILQLAEVWSSLLGGSGEEEGWFITCRAV